MKEIILVTGAAGFIGSHVVEHLINLGYTVVGLDNFDNFYDPAIKRENIRNLDGKNGCRIIEGDIRDSVLLTSIFQENKVSMVVHLAARAGVRPSLQKPLFYENNNVGGTINLLELSREHSVKRFIFASSSSVYGVDARVPFREDAKVDYPASPYAASKAAAELFCRTYSHLYDLPVTALRFFTVYGPRQRPEMAIHLFTRKIAAGQDISVLGDGTSKRDYTYIDDIADGIMRALFSTSRGFEIYNLGNSHPIALKYLIELIEKSLGKKAVIRQLPEQPGDVPITFADITKAGKDLGYRPVTTIEEGIELFTRWYLKSATNTESNLIKSVR
ncbi:MAG: GDP-mannose 4,6-dehydratase [Dehalococcoidales bacterium]|jgi:UDP-glucuronate 4-epimerase